MRSPWKEILAWSPALFAVAGGGWAVYQAHELKVSQFVSEVRQHRFQTYEDLLAAVASVNSGPLNSKAAAASLSKLEPVLDSKLPLYGSETLFPCAVSLRSVLMTCAKDPYRCDSLQVRAITISLGRDARASLAEDWDSQLRAWGDSGAKMKFCAAAKVTSKKVN